MALLLLLLRGESDRPRWRRLRRERRGERDEGRPRPFFFFFFSGLCPEQRRGKQRPEQRRGGEGAAAPSLAACGGGVPSRRWRESSGSAESLLFVGLGGSCCCCCCCRLFFFFFLVVPFRFLFLPRRCGLKGRAEPPRRGDAAVATSPRGGGGRGRVPRAGPRRAEPLRRVRWGEGLPWGVGGGDQTSMPGSRGRDRKGG